MSYGSSANWLMKARFFDRFGATWDVPFLTAGAWS